MLEKTVRVGEVGVKFRSSDTIPRLYRIKFKRDIFNDLSKLEKTFKASEGSFETDRSIAGNIDNWLDQFEMFSIYEILPKILELWGANLETEVQSKKNFQRVVGK